MTATRLIRIWQGNGFVTVKAAPTPVPGLFINQDTGAPWGWNITHLASGAAVAKHFDDPEHALHVAIQLGPLCDWTISGADLLELIPGLRQRWQQVVRKAGVLDLQGSALVPAGRIAAMEPLS